VKRATPPGSHCGAIAEPSTFLAYDRGVAPFIYPERRSSDLLQDILPRLIIPSYILPRGAALFFFGISQATAPSYNSAEMEPIEFGKKDARAHVNDEMDGEEYHDSLRGHTRQDRADMLRMGKVQELKRNYRPLSALAFTVILQGTWEVLLT
jgi:hypothetical protein